jgi:hypothetical protein
MPTTLYSGQSFYYVVQYSMNLLSFQFFFALGLVAEPSLSTLPWCNFFFRLWSFRLEMGQLTQPIMPTSLDHQDRICIEKSQRPTVIRYL